MTSKVLIRTVQTLAYQSILSICLVGNCCAQVATPAMALTAAAVATPTATTTMDANQLRDTLWSQLMEADWGGANSDISVPPDQWTYIGTAGGDNAVSVGGNYGLLLIGTIVVTGAAHDGTISWRIYPNGWNPDVQPVYGSSPPLTVHAGDTVSIPVAGSYPLVNVTPHTGQAFDVQVYSTVPVTIRGGGQGSKTGGTPCTVFIGLIAPYHEH